MAYKAQDRLGWTGWIVRLQTEFGIDPFTAVWSAPRCMGLKPCKVRPIGFVICTCIYFAVICARRFSALIAGVSVVEYPPMRTVPIRYLFGASGFGSRGVRGYF
jgi:hypothetical protein